MIKADHVLQRIQLALPIAQPFPMIPQRRFLLHLVFVTFSAAASNAFASEEHLRGHDHSSFEATAFVLNYTVPFDH